MGKKWVDLSSDELREDGIGEALELTEKDMEENEEKCSWPTICSGVTDGMTQERVGKWETTFSVINGIYILCNLWYLFLVVG